MKSIDQTPQFRLGCHLFTAALSATVILLFWLIWAIITGAEAPPRSPIFTIELGFVRVVIPAISRWYDASLAFLVWPAWLLLQRWDKDSAAQRMCRGVLVGVILGGLLQLKVSPTLLVVALAATGLWCLFDDLIDQRHIPDHSEIITAFGGFTLTLVVVCGALVGVVMGTVLALAFVAPPALLYGFRSIAGATVAGGRV